VQLSIPLAPSGDGRMLAPWLHRLLSGTTGGEPIVPAWLDATLSMATAFVLTVPTVMVYVRTRSHEDFDDTLVNTVLVLPSIVAAILVVVQSSLALAFSLTGIVAAVRFRSNVKESRDALYIFASVAIGFASGVYALDVATAISLSFVLLELFAWRSGIGGDSSRSRAVLWGEAPAPPVQPTGPVPAVPPPEVPRDIVLRVESSDRASARQVVEQILATTTKKWRFRRTAQNGGSGGSLEYHARLRRTHTPDEVRDLVLRYGAPIITSAEWST